MSETSGKTTETIWNTGKNSPDFDQSFGDIPKVFQIPIIDRSFSWNTSTKKDNNL